MKRAMKGDFDLFGKAAELWDNLDKLPETIIKAGDYHEGKSEYLKNFKKVILICIHAAVKKFEKTLVNEQEVLNNIAEMIMETYLSESLALRIRKLESLKSDISVYKDILDVNIYDASHKIRKAAHDAVFSFSEGEQAENVIKAVNLLTTVNGLNVKAARRRIAEKLIEDNSYKF